MKVAVMQPYSFPYIGYFQMIKAVDTFVFYDDVNFIKKGWINKNRILVGDKDFSFTVPLTKVSQNYTIKETYINDEMYEVWKEKFLQTLLHSYKKAPYFKEINDLILEVLNQNHKTISELAIESVLSVSNYLKIATKFLVSSESFNNKELGRRERLIDICKHENATHYINAIGGQELYSKKDFKNEGVELQFIKSLPIEYSQFNNEFVPWLSIIDVLMFNSVEEVNEMLDKFELL